MGDEQGRLFTWTQQQVNSFHIEHYLKMDCLNALRFGRDRHRDSVERTRKLDDYISTTVSCSSASEGTLKAFIISRLKFIMWGSIVLLGNAWGDLQIDTSPNKKLKANVKYRGNKNRECLYEEEQLQLSYRKTLSIPNSKYSKFQI